MAELESATRQAARQAIDASLAAWLAPQSAKAAAARLRRVGIAAVALADATDLVASGHLRARGFWNAHEGGVIPGMPWRASFGRVNGPAPGLGADTEAVLAEVLEMPADAIATLRASGSLG
jgi:crotonobetainyl-CoA:carnitine CoA-transferase CaiB-like acyl-CoA transferase